MRVHIILVRNNVEKEMANMKKKLNGVTVIGLACICCVLCGTVVYASIQNEQFDQDKKLTEIEEYNQRIEQLQEGTSVEDKEELKTVLDEKMRLEMETDTYAYDKELEVSMNSVCAAVVDMELFYSQEPNKLQKSEEKRLQLLKQLCEDYRKKLESCIESADYKELLEQFRAQTDKINQKYK